MKIESLLKERMDSFSSTDKRIAEKILTYKEVIHCDIHQFAVLCETSSASVVRFSKKIGAKGFQDLKLKIALEKEEKPIRDWNEGVNENDTIESIAHKTIKGNIDILNVMLNNIDYQVLEQVAQVIRKAENVYMFGLGDSSLIVQDMQSKLIKIKKNCIHIEDSHRQILLSRLVKPEDAVIVISYSGETREMISAAQNANTENIISITRMAANNLENHCKYNLHIPNSEGYIRLGAMSSRLCTLVLLDIIYLSIITDKLEDVKQMITECRELVL